MAQSNAFSVSVVLATGPEYIASMSPYQVRALSGSYAPTNGTSTLQAVMPSQWNGNTDIVRPWSGGAKSTTGTKMYVHGGGHADSSNNGLYSFDFAGTTRPTGWAVENAGQTGVSTDIAVGATGAPISVHTYDGMVDMGSALYRLGGSPYPNGGFATQMFRYDKASSVWTRLPNWTSGGGWFAGSAIANPAAGKILAMERWVYYQTYAFYRVATNNWSAMQSVGAQWISDGATAWNPVTNTGLMVGSSNGYGATTAFSLGIDWAAETITQTQRSLPAVGGGSAIVWDATRQRYWVWGSSGNYGTMYEIDPSNWTVSTHALTGDALAPEEPYRGTFGRHVFMESWRAIGSVVSRTGAAFVIRLPS